MFICLNDFIFVCLYESTPLWITHLDGSLEPFFVWMKSVDERELVE